MRRSSRGPPPPPKPPPPEPEGRAVAFFNSHSDATVDPRPPAEKLAEIELALKAGKIKDPDLFTILIQKKALCDLEYGSESVESVVAGVQLGALYNRLKRYESAHRHLRNAFGLSAVTPLVENDQFHLAVEYADSVLALAKNTNEIVPAERALLGFAEKETEKRELRFRRDLLMARIMKMRRRLKKALVFYEKAIISFIWFRENQESTELADLYLEAAEVAVAKGQKAMAIDWCQKANAIDEMHGIAPRVTLTTIPAVESDATE
jgi:tetratricopeptide (TPR) repeat protein